MLIRQINVTSEKNNNVFNWTGSPEIFVETKKDIEQLQQMQLLETELNFIPSAYYDVIRKLDKEMYALISEKYPEWLAINQAMLEKFYKI